MSTQQPTLFDMPSEESAAVISPCGLYRYQLTRTWDSDLATVNFVMANPSTADASQDDPTIRRCLAFSRRWGYGSLVVTNLYAFRATDPRKLAEADDPIGPENEGWLFKTASNSEMVVCAWGNLGVANGRSKAVRKLLGSTSTLLFCLGVTNAIEPRHPLYVKADQELIPWS